MADLKPLNQPQQISSSAATPLLAANAMLAGVKPIVSICCKISKQHSSVNIGGLHRHVSTIYEMYRIGMPEPLEAFHRLFSRGGCARRNLWEGRKPRDIVRPGDASWLLYARLDSTPDWHRKWEPRVCLFIMDRETFRIEHISIIGSSCPLFILGKSI